MRIERHAIDHDLAKELYDRAVDRLPRFLAAAKEKARNLDLLIDQAMTIVCCGSVVEPSSPHISRALKLAAQAHAAFFAAAGASAQPVTVTLGEEQVTYSARPDESTIYPGRWITGFFAGVLARDNGSLDVLCRVDPDSLRPSSTKSPEYDYLYMRALQAWRSGGSGLGDKIIAALQATLPGGGPIPDPQWALHLIGHQLEVLMYVVTHDNEKLGPGLAKAVDHHKQYWSKTKDRKRNLKGFISIPLTAMATQASEHGLKFDVESPYLATNLAQ